MTTERVEEKVRETLHAVALDRVRAPGDLAQQVVRRRGRRRVSQAVGAAVAVAAIAAGAMLGLGGGVAEQGRTARPAASPAGWHPWQSGVAGFGERGCLADGSALYCSGSRYDIAKVDADTGKRLWTVKVNGEGDGNDHPFAVRDGVVYAYRNHTAKHQPNGDYAGGTDLLAVDAATGERLWVAEMPQDDRTGQAAMLIDGAVWANTPSVRTMSALDPRTGAEKWHHTWAKDVVCQRAVLSGVPYLLCTPDTEEVHDTDVFRLDPATGEVHKVTTLPGRQQLVGTSEDRMVLAGAQDTAGDSLQLSTIDGSGQRTALPGRVEGHAANWTVVGDRLISVSWKGKASAYSLTTGRTLWTGPVGVMMPARDLGASLASPVASTRQQVVYFFSPSGDLSGLDLRTGKQLWHGHVDTGKPRPGFPATPQLMLYEDVLIARNGSGISSFLPRIGD
ncbi:PQQ-binding-like beta-propeller repeat protein [Streptomyces naphthomycinicus]|uniref:outer membrane protein assembly factor BamB family protein n=1 Tax=Streptomyces naphthomycinicus TaxID=2872625 RepID=UPI001CEDBC82|nr:PQQ-binding-like beta-propeller repeat protein [Streptomyces sp. TML10]